MWIRSQDGLKLVNVEKITLLNFLTNERPMGIKCETLKEREQCRSEYIKLLKAGALPTSFTERHWYVEPEDDFRLMEDSSLMMLQTILYNRALTDEDIDKFDSSNGGQHGQPSMDSFYKIIPFSAINFGEEE